jgi:hypothetical protein
LEDKAMPGKTISCPKCSATIQLASALRSGKHMRCPYCGATFTATPRNKAIEDRSATRSFVALLALGAAVLLLLGLLGGMGLTASWSRPAPVVVAAPVRTWQRDLPLLPAAPVAPVALAPAVPAVPAAPAVPAVIVQAPTVPAVPAAPAVLDTCPAPLPVTQGFLTGHWLVRLREGVTLAASFAPDGCVTYTIASPGPYPVLQQYAEFGLTIHGKYSVSGPDRMTLTATSTDFRTQPTFLNPNLLTELHLSQVCKVSVVDRDMVVLFGLRDHQRLEMTRVA